MTGLPTPNGPQDSIQPSEGPQFRVSKGESSVVFETSEPSLKDIKTSLPESVVVTTSGSEGDIVQDYAATVKPTFENIHSKVRISDTDIVDNQSIVEHQEPFELNQDIDDQINQSKWQDDLEQALEEFQSAMEGNEVDTEKIRERATEIGIEFASAPKEAIQFSVLYAVPEFAQYVDADLQNDLKEQLQSLRQPISYEEDAEEGPVTWEGLADERQEYLDEMESYFERVKDREASVDERKRHMLEVFYAHRADHLVTQD